MRPDVSHIGLAVDTGDGGSCRRPPLGGRTRLVENKILLLPTCYLAKFGRTRPDGMSSIAVIRRDNLTHHVPPFKVTQRQWKRHGLGDSLYLSLQTLTWNDRIRRDKTYVEGVF